MRSTIVAFIGLVSLTTACVAQTTRPWTQLSMSTCQVDAYRKANPNMDGRGIVIAVLDTGVDMGVTGLTKTSTGEVKVIDAQDFSSQGDIEITRAVWNEAKDRIVRYTGNGTPELFTPPPADKRPEGTTVWFAVLKEESFKNSAVPDLNDNGRRDDGRGVRGVLLVVADRVHHSGDLVVGHPEPRQGRSGDECRGDPMVGTGYAIANVVDEAGDRGMLIFVPRIRQADVSTGFQ